MTESVRVYLVGGAVRDKLLGRAVKDTDYVVVGSNPEEMLSQGFIQVGADFPVFLHPHTKQEYALARTERKSGKGYKGFSVYSSPDVTLEDDLIRRDLTINAMAIEVKGLFNNEEKTGKVIDLFGGLTDIKNGVLRHVSPAFSEDPLRVLRVARFYARYYKQKRYSLSTDQAETYGFCIAEQTLALMKQMVNLQELDNLSRERIWSESERAMLSNNPEVYWSVLDDINALYLFQPLQIAWNNKSVKAIIKEALSLSAQFDLTIEQRWAILMSSFDEQFFDKDMKDSQIMDRLCLENIDTLHDCNKIPKKTANFAKKYVQHASFLQNLDKLEAKDLMVLLQLINAHKEPDQIDKLLMVNKVIDIAKKKVVMKKALLSFHSITINDIDSSLKGKDIGKALNENRIKHLIDELKQ